MSVCLHDDRIAMTPLERGHLNAARLRAAISALVLAGLAAAIVAGVRTRIPTLLPGLLLAPLLPLFAYTILVAPARRHRAWGYRLADDELRVAHGVWTRVETHVPLARVQHVDVSQGPIERAFRVCRLILHTAGTANSVVVLPGLSRTTAETIRDEVRSRVREEDL